MSSSKRSNIVYIAVRAHPGPKPTHNTFKDVPVMERGSTFSKQEIKEACDLINNQASKGNPLAVSIEHTYLDQSLYPHDKVPQLRTGYAASASMNPKDNDCMIVTLAFDTNNPYDFFALKSIKDNFLKEVSLHHSHNTYTGNPRLADILFKNFDPQKKVFEVSLVEKGRRENCTIFNPDNIIERATYAASNNSVLQTSCSSKISQNDIINNIYDMDLNELNQIKQNLLSLL